MVGFKPHKYQEYAIDRILDNPAAGLFELERGAWSVSIFEM